LKAVDILMADEEPMGLAFCSSSERFRSPQTGATLP
jgi:hypothetical protein